MLLSGLTTAMFGFGYYLQIHRIEYYIFVQIFGGLVQATGWPSVVACVGHWFGKGRRGFIMGVWNSHTSAGNILGSVIAGLFVSSSWGLSFIVPGAIIFAVGCFCLLASSSVNQRVPAADTDPLLPRHSTLTESTASSDMGSRKAISLLGAVRIPGVIEYSLCLFFAKLVSYTFLYWLPNYIKHSSGLNPEESAFLSTLFDVGGIVGGVLAGVVSDVTGRRALTCMMMLLLAAPMVFLLLITGGLVNGPYALITTAVSADLGTSVKGDSKALATVTAIIDGTGSMGM
uniref:MFS domain-containing protein n=1 Tax=Macrostomum lignano TaxID=282301 RepID=A0A1I8HQU8_9PLAT